jgi:hypothetical protein
MKRTGHLLRATFETLPDGYHLLVGKDIDDLGAFAKKIKAALLGGIALIFVLAGLASVSVTRRTVGRIEAINATSRAIMQSGLGKRIPLRETRDEWDQLAENLNLMLDRIEALIGEVKQATDSVAHDLRTPLARMRGRLEKAYNRQRDGAYDQLLIGDTMADLDAVLRMFASLTRISQIEANDRTAAFPTVNLSGIASEAVELFDAAAEEKGGRLNAVGDQKVLVKGDRDLLWTLIAICDGGVWCADHAPIVHWGSFGGALTQILGERDERDHEVRQIRGDLRIGLEIGQGTRRRNFLAAFDHRPGPEFESLRGVQHGLVERIARRDAAKQIREPDAYGLAFFFFDDGDVVGHMRIQSFGQFASRQILLTNPWPKSFLGCGREIIIPVFGLRKI